MPAWMTTLVDYISSAAVKVAAWLLTLTSTGVVALSEPPAPPVVPGTPDRLTQELTVMSFNVWTDKDSLDQRLNGVVQTVLSERPDSFGLQEAHEIWRFKLWWALRNDYGIACWQGRYFGFQEATPIFYRKDKFCLVKQGVFWLSDKPGIASMGWDANLPRVAGYAVLKDKKTGFTYAHFNTHFDHMGQTARANSARLAADRINAMGKPAVLTGDLNARPGSLPIQYLEAGGLIDLRKAAGTTDTGGTYVGSTGIIDYIYANHYLRDEASAVYRVIRDQYDGMFPSDHFAVCATLTLAN